MTTIYHVRKACETETGDGKGFHYFRAEQTDEVHNDIVCPEHPTAGTRDFVIEWKEVIA